MPENIRINVDEVKITDVDIPFFSLVFLMVKIAIAAIPAAIIIGITYAIAAALFFGGVFGG